jgi:hypothetical protein
MFARLRYTPAMSTDHDSAPASSAPPDPALKPPIPNSYWLPGGMIAAGEYPGGSTASLARERLGQMIDAGIRSFVDLTQPHDPLLPYDVMLSMEGRERDVETRYKRFGIEDMGVTDVATMRKILDYIDAEVAAGRKVYIHCWGGVGRTGTTVGCYLVRHGQTCDEALSTVGRLFATMSEGKTSRFPEGSPQTHVQRAMVAAWTEETEGET